MNKKKFTTIHILHDTRQKINAIVTWYKTKTNYSIKFYDIMKEIIDEKHKQIQDKK